MTVKMFFNFQKKKVYITNKKKKIMSESCAKKCGLLRLIDRNFAGVAQGVGTCKILGRVHSAQMKIGKSFFLSSFTIIQNQEGGYFKIYFLFFFIFYFFIFFFTFFFFSTRH